MPRSSFVRTCVAKRVRRNQCKSQSVNATGESVCRRHQGQRECRSARGCQCHQGQRKCQTIRKCQSHRGKRVSEKVGAISESLRQGPQSKRLSDQGLVNPERAMLLPPKPLTSGVRRPCEPSEAFYSYIADLLCPVVGVQDDLQALGAAHLRASKQGGDAPAARREEARGTRTGGSASLREHKRRGTWPTGSCNGASSCFSS